MKTGSKVLATLAVTLSVTVATWAPSLLTASASADARDASAVTADAVAVAVGAESEQTSLTASGSVSTSLGDLKVPADASQAITLGPLAVNLPATGATELVGGDAVVTGEDTSFVVDALPDGLRIASVLNSADADHSITYELGLPAGVTPKLKSDGSVDLGVASFATPWAVDANGKKVATEYVVTGSTVTQVVTPDADAVYPIVADPRVSGCLIGGWYPAMCITYNRQETINAYNSIAWGIGAAAGAAELCSGIPSAPVKIACKAGVALIFYTVIDSARNAYNSGRCLQIRFTYPAIPAILGYSNVVNC